jgi:hypothetical protein
LKRIDGGPDSILLYSQNLNHIDDISGIAGPCNVAKWSPTQQKGQAMCAHFCSIGISIRLAFQFDWACDYSSKGQVLPLDTAKDRSANRRVRRNKCTLAGWVNGQGIGRARAVEVVHPPTCGGRHDMIVRVSRASGDIETSSE